MAELIHVIDDDEGVRLGLCALLEAKDYKSIPHASCEAFLNDYTAETTLCIVADLRLPGLGGLDLQAHLLGQAIDLPFIVITGHGDVSSAVRALKAGAVDFIEKPIDGKMFLSAVDRAIRTRRAALKTSAMLASAREKFFNLTPREHDVLRHIVNGNPNKIIAHELGISPRTVENHRARLMDKMKAASLADLVSMALAAGLSSKSSA